MGYLQHTSGYSDGGILIGSESNDKPSQHTLMLQGAKTSIFEEMPGLGREAKIGLVRRSME